MLAQLSHRRDILVALTALTAIGLSLVIATGATAQDNAPYGDAAWNQTNVESAGSSTVMSDNPDEFGNPDRIDGDSFALCYIDDSDSDSLNLALTNDTGRSWTTREVTVTDIRRTCDVASEPEDGNFSIIYTERVSTENHPHLAETSDWGKTWTITDLTTVSGAKQVAAAAREVRLLVSTGEIQQFYARIGPAPADLQVWDTTDDWTTIQRTNITSGVEADSLEVEPVAFNDIFAFYQPTTTDDCQYVRYKPGGGESIDELGNLTTARTLLEDNNCAGWGDDTNDDRYFSALDTSNDEYVIWRASSSSPNSWTEVQTFSSGGRTEKYEHTFLRTDEGLFFTFARGADPDRRVCESDDDGTTWGCDTAIPAQSNGAGELVRVDNAKPGLLGDRTNDVIGDTKAFALTWAWPENGTDVLPFTEVSPQHTFTALAKGTGIEANYVLSTPTVWVRDREVAPNPSKLFKLNATLVEQTRQSYCDDLGELDARSNDGLSVTLDNLPVSVCRQSGTSDELAVLTDTSGVVTDSYETKGDSIPINIEAVTGNRVGWTPSLQQSAEEADLKGFSSVLRDKASASVDIGIFDRKWITHTGPSGTFTFDKFGGNLKASATARNWESVQANDTQVWSGDTETNEIARWVISGGGYNQQETATISIDDTHALRLSPDAELLLVIQSNDRVALLDSENLTTLAKTTVVDGVSDADIDGCNNWLYTVNDTTAAAFDVTKFTSCEPFGGTDEDGTNDPQGNEPFGDDTDEQTQDVANATQEDDGFGALSASQVGTAFGIDDAEAGWLLGAILIIGLGGGLGLATRNPGAGFAGAVGGLALATPFGWIPLWFTVTLGVVAAAIIAFVNRGA